MKEVTRFIELCITWSRSNTQVGASANECARTQHFSRQKPLAGSTN